MKTVPLMTTYAEAFLAQFRPLTWETAPKSARINMRVPEALLAALKARAAARGVPYQRLIRELLESAVAVG